MKNKNSNQSVSASNVTTSNAAPIAPATTATPPVAAPATTPTASPSSLGTALLVTNPTPPTPSITSVANASNKGTKVDLQTSLAALVSGLLQYYQPTDVFDLKSGSLTRDEVIAKMHEFIQTAEDTKASNKVWRGDVQTERAMALQVRPVRAGVVSIVQAKFGKDGAQLLDFGIPLTKPGKPSVVTMAAALAKRKATRAARGTKGTAQKAEMQGNVTGVTITPVTAPEPTPAPAPSAAPPIAPTVTNGAGKPAGS